jgi:hypothetical protein
MNQKEGTLNFHWDFLIIKAWVSKDLTETIDGLLEELLFIAFPPSDETRLISKQRPVVP